jgi:hypothetical protein
MSSAQLTIKQLAHYTSNEECLSNIADAEFVCHINDCCVCTSFDAAKTDWTTLYYCRIDNASSQRKQLWT